MGEVCQFERLVETVELIRRHADYPGKQMIVDRCHEEVEDLTRSGRITTDQRDTLRGILRGEPIPTIRRQAGNR